MDDSSECGPEQMIEVEVGHIAAGEAVNDAEQVEANERANEAREEQGKVEEAAVEDQEEVANEGDR